MGKLQEIGPENIDDFDEIIDVRSPGEFVLDCLPGAINLPVLSNDERKTVGTIYKQESSFLARRLGAGLVTRNISNHLQGYFANKQASYNPLVYCWRGGMRSHSLANLLAAIGWKTAILKGGYRAYRDYIRINLKIKLEELAPAFCVISGYTGTGKTNLLKALKGKQAQVINLEELAGHRGSALGELPGATQPSQKKFENLLFQEIKNFSVDRKVFIEAESYRIGKINLPLALWNAMRTAKCTQLNCSLEKRVENILCDYTDLFKRPDLIKDKIRPLSKLHSKKTIAHWRCLIDEKRWEEFSSELLSKHYDPSYERSQKRSYQKSSTLFDITAQTLENVATELLTS